MALTRWVANLGALAVAAGVLATPVDAMAQQAVLLFTSGENDRSKAIIDSFKDALEGAAKLSFDLGTSEQDATFVADSVKETVQADLIFVVGDIALKVAAREFPSQPILYADVGATTVAALARADVRVVPAHPDPGALIGKITTLMPKAKTVGAVISTRSDHPFWGGLQEACVQASLNCPQVKVAAPSEIGNALQTLTASADLVLLQPDDKLWSANALASSFRQAAMEGVPVMSWDTAHMSSPQGPPLVVVTRPADLGVAAAAMAQEFLAGDKDITQVATAYPAPVIHADKRGLMDLRVLLNKKTAVAIDQWKE